MCSQSNFAPRTAIKQITFNYPPPNGRTVTTHDGHDPRRSRRTVTTHDGHDPRRSRRTVTTHVSFGDCLTVPAIEIHCPHPTDGRMATVTTHEDWVTVTVLVTGYRNRRDRRP
jgi:hypothetical protein